MFVLRLQFAAEKCKMQRMTTLNSTELAAENYVIYEIHENLKMMMMKFMKITSFETGIFHQFLKFACYEKNVYS